MRLFHIADIHLGRRRLDGRLPDKDFADAFAFVAERAIEERANAFLIAGDMFDRSQVEPPHLRQAQQVLFKLKQAQIPVLSIEGNHDKASVHSEAPTWLQYLAEDDLLILLKTQFNSDGPIMSEWRNHREGGSWLDLGGIRFVGAGYLGAATPHKVRDIASRLEAGKSHVLILHAGPEYFTGEGGGFSASDLEALRSRVAYLALGHIHKPMQHGDWACNPGSPENCDLREASFPEPRGYAVLELEPGLAKPSLLETRNTPRRECRRLKLDCTGFGNKLKKGAEALVDAAVDLIKHSGAGREAVIDLKLTGELNLNRIALDQALAAEEIEKASKVRAVSLDTTDLNRADAETGAPQAADPGRTQEEFEKGVIQKLVSDDHLWGLEERQEQFTALFYELKEAVRAGKSGEELADRIAQSMLVGQIQKSLQELESRQTREQRDKWKEKGQSASTGFEALDRTAQVQSEATAR